MKRLISALMSAALANIRCSKWVESPSAYPHYTYLTVSLTCIADILPSFPFCVHGIAQRVPGQRQLMTVLGLGILGHGIAQREPLRIPGLLTLSSYPIACLT